MLILTVAETDVQVIVAERPPAEAGICREVDENDQELVKIVQQSIEIGRRPA